MFTTRKVAQMAAYFAECSGGTINILKLIKLMYLADRESMHRHGTPISFDRFVSMDHGPVPSQSLNLVNGCATAKDGAVWDEWISDRENHTVRMERTFERSDLNELSDADLEVQSDIWKQFGHLSQWDLVKFTHEHLPEWTDPKGSSIPILDIDIFRALGTPDDEAEELADELASQRAIDKVFASI